MSQGFCEFYRVKEDVKHYLIDCLEIQNLQEKLVREVMAKDMIVPVKTLLNGKYFYELIWGYVNKTGKKIVVKFVLTLNNRLLFFCFFLSRPEINGIGTVKALSFRLCKLDVGRTPANVN